MKQRMLIYGTLALIASLAIVARSRPQKTVAERLVEYGPAARARLEPHFKKVSLAYPPARLVLVGIKDERRLELYGAASDGKLRYLRDYRVLSASDHNVLLDPSRRGEFHATIYEAAGAPDLFDLMRRNSGHVDRIRRLNLPRP